MAASKDDNKRPIIIKKVKKVAGGHHGGAWKVAYADFVTAMMAFFLLLWLLSSSSKETLAGLSEYFTPTQGITGNIGITDAGGESPDVQGTKKSSLSEQTIVAGNTPSGEVAESPEKQAKTDSKQDDNLFEEGGKAIEQAFTQEAALTQYSDNVSVTQTPEGLRIDITDTDKYAMFERSSPNFTEHGRTVVKRIAELLKKMPNFMAIYGHTDSSPAEAGNADYTNWELSSDRAQAARRFLLSSGIERERPKKVTGMADKELFTPSEPRGPRNRRISVVMLRGSHILIPDAAIPQDATETPSPPAPDAAGAMPKAMPAADAGQAAEPSTAAH